MKKILEESKVALVYGQMNEPPGARMRVGLTALTMAEYFRDVNKQDVLLFIDNIFRFVQAGSEVSALLGRMPSAVGYQPTLSTEMGSLQERITSTKKGSITSIQAVYVPADDLTDPACTTSTSLFVSSRSYICIPECDSNYSNHFFSWQVVSASGVAEAAGNKVYGKVELGNFSLALKWSKIGNFHMSLIQVTEKLAFFIQVYLSQIAFYQHYSKLDQSVS